jgi:hypothetical protein
MAWRALSVRQPVHDFPTGPLLHLIEHCCPYCSAIAIAAPLTLPGHASVGLRPTNPNRHRLLAHARLPAGPGVRSGKLGHLRPARRSVGVAQELHRSCAPTQEQTQSPAGTQHD